MHHPVEVSHTLVLPVAEASGVGEARRRASALAREVGFDETDAGRVALVATEAAGNLVKHTHQGGTLLVRALCQGDTAEVEIVALDTGPGIERLAEALRDGFSTAGSPGTGLGAIARTAHDFDIHSLPGMGTALLARVRARRASGDGGVLEVGAVSVPAPGETVCGDGWAVTEDESGVVSVLVVDGLGHGPGAAEAADAARRAFAATQSLAPGVRLQRVHTALQGTRGAAGAIAEVDPGRGRLRYAGIGNISGVVHTADGTQSLVSHNGILGHQLRAVQEFVHPWPAGAVLVMHSDGVATRWSLDRYPGLAARHPALLAGTLFRDFCRGRDDATVVAAREPLRP